MAGRHGRVFPGWKNVSHPNLDPLQRKHKRGFRARVGGWRTSMRKLSRTERIGTLPPMRLFRSSLNLLGFRSKLLMFSYRATLAMFPLAPCSPPIFYNFACGCQRMFTLCDPFHRGTRYLPHLAPGL